MTNQDRRNLRKLRHTVEQAVAMLESAPSPARAAWARVVQARDTLRIALEETAPEPDPGDALDAAEIHPRMPDR